MRKNTRPGGRTARVRATVLDATIDILKRDGFGKITFEGVAERSGVHRTTLHRRWPSRAALVADALSGISASEITIPDTGRLRTDLRRFALAVRDALATPLARTLLSALAEPRADGELGKVARRFWDTRFAATRTIVERAIERGELPRSTDPRFVIEALGGPIWFRTFVVAEPCDHRFLDRVVDSVIAGVKGRTR